MSWDFSDWQVVNDTKFLLASACFWLRVIAALLAGILIKLVLSP